MKDVIDYLVDEGKLSLDDYNKTYMYYLESDGPYISIYEELVNILLVSEKDLIEAFMSVCNIKFVDLNNYSISKDLSKRIPPNIAREYGIMPFKEDGEFLYIAMKDPTDLLAISEAKDYSRLRIKPYVSYISSVNKTISKFYGTEKADAAIAEMSKDVETDDTETTSVFLMEGDSSATTNFVNTIIKRAISEMASDIHIEPTEDETVTRIRVDGLLRDIQKAPISLHSSVVARIKVMGNMDVSEKRVPQDGRSTVESEGETIDLRISSLPTVFGEKIVIRLLRKSSAILDKSAIGLREDDMKKYDEILRNHNGVILMVGPTGSGKSTTMATMIKVLNKRDVNIITLEDPVEFNIPGISQVQINEKTGMTFAKGLKAALRQDPDIICVGEIRDAETAEIAMRAAITGHLVISTLHTNDAISAFDRLKDMGIPSYLISASIIGVISQRLVRKVCVHCLGRGCAICSGSGYAGRTGVFEILATNREFKKAITTDASRDTLESIARNSGFKKLKEACVELVNAGITTESETSRIINAID